MKSRFDSITRIDGQKVIDFHKADNKKQMRGKDITGLNTERWLGLVSPIVLKDTTLSCSPLTNKLSFAFLLFAIYATVPQNLDFL